MDQPIRGESRAPDPLDVISHDVWHASNSITAADTQSFLDAQTCLPMVLRGIMPE